MHINSRTGRSCGERKGGFVKCSSQFGGTTIAVAVGVGYGLDLIDKRVHATEHVTSWFRSIGESVKHAAEYLAKSMPKDYDSYPLMYMP